LRAAGEASDRPAAPTGPGRRVGTLRGSGRPSRTRRGRLQLALTRVRSVGSDAELHTAINDGEREVEIIPSASFALLETFGLARADRVREPRAERLDLIAVTAAGAQPYLAANAVVAGGWAGEWGRRRPLKAVMGNRV